MNQTINKQELFALLKKQNGCLGNMGLIVNEPIMFEHTNLNFPTLDAKIALGDTIFQKLVVFGGKKSILKNIFLEDSKFESFVKLEGVGLKDFRCDQAIFEEEVTCNGISLSMFDCGKAKFKKAFKALDSKFGGFYCAEPTFEEEFLSFSTIFLGNFYCGKATFKKGITLNEAAHTKFEGVFIAPNHPELAKQILYYKQGIII